MPARSHAIARRPASAVTRAPAEIVDFLEVAIDAAERHGRESEPDHEVGDLQDLARALWKHLPAEARAAVAREWEPWGMEPREVDTTWHGFCRLWWLIGKDPIVIRATPRR